MKNLFIISESEKSRILEMHKNAIKRQYLNEDVTDVEPVLRKSLTTTFYESGLPSGQATVTDTKVKTFVKSASDIIKKSCKTLQKFSALTSKFEIPKMFEIYIGTDSVGDGVSNTATYNKRLAKAQEIIRKAFTESGCNISDNTITELLDDKSNYDKTNVDKNVSDEKENPLERYIKIVVVGIKESGRTTDKINIIANMLRDAKGLNIDPDEDKIKNAFCALQTYSDIQDLDNNLEDGVQSFINSTITDNPFWNDKTRRFEIRDCLNKASQNSGKGDIAMISGDQMTVNIEPISTEE